MKLSQFIPEIKIQPKYNNRILFNFLKNELWEFIDYIDNTYNWRFKPYIKDIEYNKDNDLILLIDKKKERKIDYISVDINQLEDFRYDFNSNKTGEDIARIEYKNKTFYLI